jgi:hypothetical protein
LENIKVSKISSSLERKEMDPLLEADGVMRTRDKEKAQ